MEAADLEYTTVVTRIAPFIRGRGESIGFLSWFLQNIFRLDDVEAEDAICDAQNDKGIDGIVIDEIGEQVLVLQSKLRQNAARKLGDADLKTFEGTLEQLQSADSIKKLLSGTADDGLKQLLRQHDIAALIAKGYSIKGIFVTNQEPDPVALEYLEHVENIELYDRARISREYVELDAPQGVEDEAKLSLADFRPLVYSMGATTRMYLFPAQASELVKLEGISDGRLFAKNVRLSLGRTKVNKDIAATVADKSEHLGFPLFHNGITIVCDNAKIDANTLIIQKYVVVNGAQSLTVLDEVKRNISPDLRLLVRVIEVHGDEALADKITSRSNNQNAVKPRDGKANSPVQIRLQQEFQKTLGGRFFFEVKRGEIAPAGTEKISNEDAGRLLLAFDRGEPWASHQVYRIFDEDYSSIFGRREVTAERIILLHLIMQEIEERVEKIDVKPLANYRLTKYMLLFAVRRILDTDTKGVEIIRNPSSVMKSDEDRECFLRAVARILDGIIVDLNYAVKRGKLKEYKSDLKSQEKILDVVDDLLKDYEKDLARGRVASLADMLAS